MNSARIGIISLLLGLAITLTGISESFLPRTARPTAVGAALTISGLLVVSFGGFFLLAWSRNRKRGGGAASPVAGDEGAE